MERKHIKFFNAFVAEHYNPTINISPAQELSSEMNQASIDTSEREKTTVGEEGEKTEDKEE